MFEYFKDFTRVFGFFLIGDTDVSNKKMVGTITHIKITKRNKLFWFTYLKKKT